MPAPDEAATAPDPPDSETPGPVAKAAAPVVSNGYGVGGGRPTLGRYAEIGSTGLRQTSGFVHEEFLPQLAGDKALRVFREMRDNDPVCGGILFAIDMLMRQVDWRVEPAEASSVEDIVAARTEDRAKAIMAAQQADYQRQQMANMQAQAAQMLPAQKPGQKPSPARQAQVQKLAKALGRRRVVETFEALGIDPALITEDAFFPHALDVTRWVHKAEMGEDVGQGATAGAPVPRPKPPPVTDSKGQPVPEPKGPPGPLDVDPMEAAKREGEEWAVFVETCLDDMSASWEDTLSEILTMLPFGFHVAEIVYKKRVGQTAGSGGPSKYNDGKIGWRRLAGRAQETRFRWEIEPGSGNLNGMWQLDPSIGKGAVLIPAERMLLFRTRTAKNNPEGSSILRTAYRPWFFKKRIEEIEAIGIERDLAGLPVISAPPELFMANRTPDEAAMFNLLQNLARSIKRDEQEGVVWPLDYDPETNNPRYKLELLSTGGQRQFDTDKIVVRYDQRIAMCVLADFILLGHENVGSKALGKTKADLFTAALEAWLDSIADVFNTYAIPRLMKMNGQDPAMSPSLTHGRLSQVDLAELGTFLVSLSQAGAPLFPDDSLESYLRDVAGMPDKEETHDL